MASAAKATPPGNGVPIRVPLPAGRVLEVRSAVAEDVEALDRLFSELDLDDRYRRFFSAFFPSQAFLERMVTVADRGGCQLVAVADPDDAEHRIVGEAGFAILPDGDGELGLTVARGWRGWLGPYLLDVLIEEAARRGVANIEADVLLMNTPMLGLLRARGSAVMAHVNWTTTRLLVGTAGDVPSWPDSGRPRVLVEVPGGRWHAEGAARAAGFDVLVCSGPGRRPHGCPALAGQPCPLAAGADIIVMSDTPDAEPWPAVTAAHGRLHPSVPVCLEPRREGPPDDAGMVALLGELLDTVPTDRASAGRDRSEPPDRQ